MITAYTIIKEKGIYKIMPIRLFSTKKEAQKCLDKVDLKGHITTLKWTKMKKEDLTYIKGDAYSEGYYNGFYAGLKSARKSNKQLEEKIKRSFNKCCTK